MLKKNESVRSKKAFREIQFTTVGPIFSTLYFTFLYFAVTKHSRSSNSGEDSTMLPGKSPITNRRSDGVHEEHDPELGHPSKFAHLKQVVNGK